MTQPLHMFCVVILHFTMECNLGQFQCSWRNPKRYRHEKRTKMRNCKTQSKNWIWLYIYIRNNSCRPRTKLVRPHRHTHVQERLVQTPIRSGRETRQHQLFHAVCHGPTSQCLKSYHDLHTRPAKTSPRTWAFRPAQLWPRWPALWTPRDVRRTDGFLLTIGMASNLIGMASNPIAMPSNLIAMAFYSNGLEP